MPPKNKIEENVTLNAEEQANVNVDQAKFPSVDVEQEVKAMKADTEINRRLALLDEAVALSGQIQYYNSGIHGVDGDMSYTLAVSPTVMVAVRQLLTILRAEIVA